MRRSEVQYREEEGEDVSLWKMFIGAVSDEK
jgi:hypothetical protein